MANTQRAMYAAITHYEKCCTRYAGSTGTVCWEQIPARLTQLSWQLLHENVKLQMCSMKRICETTDVRVFTSSALASGRTVWKICDPYTAAKPEPSAIQRSLSLDSGNYTYREVAERYYCYYHYHYHYYYYYYYHLIYCPPYSFTKINFIVYIGLSFPKNFHMRKQWKRDRLILFVLLTTESKRTELFQSGRLIQATYLPTYYSKFTSETNSSYYSFPFTGR
jgi:hypothetical protein